MEVPRLQKEHGSDHGGLNFPFKALTALLLLQEKILRAHLNSECIF